MKTTDPAFRKKLPHKMALPVALALRVGEFSFGCQKPLFAVDPAKRFQTHWPFALKQDQLA
jgi:hypothetical protein